MSVTLDTQVCYLKKVGDKKEKFYNRLQIFTVEQLLYHMPKRYVDLSSPVAIADAVLGEVATISATITGKAVSQQVGPRMTIYKIPIQDENGDIMNIVFFNNWYGVKALEVGQTYKFYGKIEEGYKSLEMKSPGCFDGNIHNLVPVYPQTAGITTKTIAQDIGTAMDSIGEIPDPLSEEIRQLANIVDLQTALKFIHTPDNWEQVTVGRRRLAFDELLLIAIGVIKTNSDRKVANTAPMQAKDLQPLYDSLPFTPTDDQLQAISQSVKNMQAGTVMNRLVQGDVGSGKTMVALACCYFCYLNGYQSTIMAPTEILAEQHFANISKLLEPLGVRVALLTGSLTAKNKRLLKEKLANGEIDLCVGTHALITQDTIMKNLGLVVTDEQHRFGVAQRMALAEKGKEVHTLVMSATPIPRTLGLILYGDMEISVIKQLPKGRQPISTFLIGENKRTRALGYIKDHLDKGQQGYIVCPLVEDDPETNTKGKSSAIEMSENLSNNFFQNYKVGLLHGKMKAKDKDAVMQQFARGELQLLVATTVIEVGIDVPNSTIILIENSENFGLSQLHQLRGRVGRGSEPSTCILVTSSHNPTTQERLKTLCKNTDGFAIAEYDLETRGIGDFFGIRQHGLPSTAVANLLQDSSLLSVAKEIADFILTNDPQLKQLPLVAAKIDKMMATAAVL